MEILSVFNAKGGVGKTTTAVNLAACFAVLGLRVVVFDLDAQGNATASLGVRKTPETGTYDVITGSTAIADALVPSFMENLSLVGATKILATIDVDLALGSGKTNTVRQAAEAIKDDIDILILDCAPTFGSMTINALVSADMVIIPSQPHPFAHDGLIRTWSILGRIKTEMHPTLKVLGILPTFCDTNVGSDEKREDSTQILAAMHAEFGNAVVEPGIPNDPELFISASGTGLPACVYAPHSPASTAYITMALRLLGMSEDQNSVPAKSADSLLNLLDQAPFPSPSLIEMVSDKLEFWQQQAKEDGWIDDRINLPEVDSNAVNVAKQADEHEPTFDFDGSSISRTLIFVSCSLALAILTFIIGWAVGMGHI